MTNVESNPAVTKKDRGSAIAAGKAKKFALLFEGRKFRIVENITAPQGQPFKTSLGNRASKGAVIVEIGNEENTLTVGAAVLRRAADEYDAVTLPPKRGRGRPRKNPVDNVPVPQTPEVAGVVWD